MDHVAHNQCATNSVICSRFIKRHRRRLGSIARGITFCLDEARNSGIVKTKLQLANRLIKTVNGSQIGWLAISILNHPDVIRCICCTGIIRVIKVSFIGTTCQHNINSTQLGNQGLFHHDFLQVGQQDDLIGPIADCSVNDGLKFSRKGSGSNLELWVSGGIAIKAPTAVDTHLGIGGRNVGQIGCGGADHRNLFTFQGEHRSRRNGACTTVLWSDINDLISDGPCEIIDELTTWTKSGILTEVKVGREVGKQGTDGFIVTDQVSEHRRAFVKLVIAKHRGIKANDVQQLHINRTWRLLLTGANCVLDVIPVKQRRKSFIQVVIGLAVIVCSSDSCFDTTRVVGGSRNDVVTC